MDWNAAIEKNRQALVQIIGALLASMGLTASALGEGGSFTLTRQMRSAVLHVLRPAESALRRLIVIAARGLEAKPPLSRQSATDFSALKRYAGRGGQLFQLYDPRKRFAPEMPRRDPKAPKPMPRVSVPGWVEPVFEAPKQEASPDDQMDASHIMARLKVLKAAMEDIPGQAKRLARREAARALAPPGPKCVPPLRCGWPPFYRQRHRHRVDALLAECQALACQALEPPG